MKKWKAVLKNHSDVLGNYLIAVLLVAGISIFYRGFGSLSHISVLLSDLAILGFLVIGQTFPVLTGGIDMSVPYMMNAAAVVLNYGINTKNWNLPTAFLIVAAMTLLAGAISGFGIAYLKVHPMIMTYGMNSIMMGALLSWTKGTAGGFTPRGLTVFSKAKLGFLPVVTLFFAAGVLILMLVLKRSAYGKRLYAVGNCKRAAYFSGVNVKAVTMIAYMISAVCAAIGGLIMSGRVGQSYLGMGDSYMFITLAAVAIGGISMNGGRGHVVGSASGALLITIVLSMLTVLKASLGVQQLLYGVVLLCAIVLEANKMHFRGRRKQKS
ncbi:MAG: ABC transporter permease [Lachnospiraceae bacterium]|nr:ABC transporter permease [Lachnospiraceae bacterium]